MKYEVLLKEQEGKKTLQIMAKDDIDLFKVLIDKTKPFFPPVIKAWHIAIKSKREIPIESIEWLHQVFDNAHYESQYVAIGSI
ncbi:hypothetical protein KAU40_02035 [Candidatus Parcubacteria bacterium]|nr:hypothetical protein [Candidatus Parcubacteria bacterium]